MEKEFWIDRWNNNQIGFHQLQYHAFLANYFPILKLQNDQTVFVPLCGKSLDIEFLLKQGLKVIGCELAESAIIELFKNLNLTPQITTTSKFKIYSADKFKIFVGDFFKIQKEDLNTINAVYDRAAIVALPLEMRKKYSNHLAKISNNAQQLLITFDYDQTQIDGPPFAVSANEVNSHYSPLFQCNLLETIDLPNGMKGKTSATENAWHIIIN